MFLRKKFINWLLFSREATPNLFQLNVLNFDLNENDYVLRLILAETVEQISVSNLAFKSKYKILIELVVEINP